MVRIMQYLQNVENFAIAKQQLIESGILDRMNETLIRMAPEAVDPAILSRGSLSRRQYTRSAILLLQHEEQSMKKPKCMEEEKLASFPFWKPQGHTKKPEKHVRIQHPHVNSTTESDLFKRFDPNPAYQCFKSFSQTWLNRNKLLKSHQPKPISKIDVAKNLAGLIRKDMMSAIPRSDRRDHQTHGAGQLGRDLKEGGATDEKRPTIKFNIPMGVRYNVVEEEEEDEEEPNWDSPDLEKGEVWDFKGGEYQRDVVETEVVKADEATKQPNPNEPACVTSSDGTPPPARSTPTKLGKKPGDDGKNVNLHYNFDEILKLDGLSDILEGNSNNQQPGESRFRQWFKSSNPTINNINDRERQVPSSVPQPAPTQAFNTNQQNVALHFIQQLRNNPQINALNIVQLQQLLGSINPIAIAYRNLILQVMQRNNLKSVDQVEALMRRQMANMNIRGKSNNGFRNTMQPQYRTNPWPHPHNDAFQKFLSDMRQRTGNSNNVLNNIRHHDLRRQQDHFQRHGQRPKYREHDPPSNLRLGLFGTNNPRIGQNCFYGNRRNFPENAYKRRESAVYHS